MNISENPFVRPPSPIIGHYASHTSHTPHMHVSDLSEKQIADALATRPGQPHPVETCVCSICTEVRSKQAYNKVSAKQPHPVETCACDICTEVRDGLKRANAIIDSTRARIPDSTFKAQPCYVVLSISQLEAMLAKARSVGVRADETRLGSHCSVFEAMIRPDSRGKLQISSFDLAKGPAL